MSYTTRKPWFLSCPAWQVIRFPDGLFIPLLTGMTSTPGYHQVKRFKKIGAKSYRFLLCCFSSSCPSCNISISNKCLVCMCLVPKVQWPLRTQAQLILLHSVSIPWRQSCWYVTIMAQTVSSCDNPTPQWCWNKRMHLAFKFFLFCHLFTVWRLHTACSHCSGPPSVPLLHKECIHFLKK